MRVNPVSKNTSRDLYFFRKSVEIFLNFLQVLNWRYSDVWTFIRGLSLPYPSLYDRGYTSLGGLRNTSPNQALRLIDAEKLKRFDF